MKLLLPALLLPTVLATSTAAVAHNDCNVDLDGGIRIDDSSITFIKNKNPLYIIEDDNILLVNGERISLSSSQEALVYNYSTSIRQTVPEVKEIALGAIDVAVDGVNLAFNELLGEGNNVSSDLTHELGRIRDQVELRFNTQAGFTIDEEGFSGDEILGEGFETQLEEVVEDAVQNSIGTLMVALGQELIFSGGDMKAFETRMEDFGTRIESEMEMRAAHLEEKGEALCQSAMEIDSLEEQLRSEVSELSHFNVISVSSDKNSSI